MSLRRLTILIDRSSSMAGAPIGQATAFVEWSLLPAMRANRHLYGQVEVSLVAFDCSAEWLMRETDIDGFAFPDIHEIAPFGGASIGAALRLLDDDISRRGDSGSDLIVLVSDGHFVDDVVDAVDAFSERSNALRISFGVDDSFRDSLAYFENWQNGGRRAAEELFRITPQDVEAMLACI